MIIDNETYKILKKIQTDPRILAKRPGQGFINEKKKKEVVI